MGSQTLLRWRRSRLRRAARISALLGKNESLELLLPVNTLENFAVHALRLLKQLCSTATRPVSLFFSAVVSAKISLAFAFSLCLCQYRWVPSSIFICSLVSCFVPLLLLFKVKIDELQSGTIDQIDLNGSCRFYIFTEVSGNSLWVIVSIEPSVRILLGNSLRRGTVAIRITTASYCVIEPVDEDPFVALVQDVGHRGLGGCSLFSRVEQLHQAQRTQVCARE